MMMKKLLPLILFVIIALCVGARSPQHSVKVDEKALKRQAKVFEPTDSALILTEDDAVTAVRFFGYDKPHNASQESFFITNELSADTIYFVRFEIEYLSVAGTRLHKREETRETKIEPGETTRMLIPTWDATRTFYYFRTPPGRKQGLTPYKVRIHPVAITLTPGCEQ